ncbi:MAG: hypothetical protein EA402_01615 [Planctomycetota bacterium]|nr:MAG: hypothetical protein EA402_01615 [Planctomycetota bacterium]
MSRVVTDLIAKAKAQMAWAQMLVLQGAQTQGNRSTHKILTSLTYGSAAPRAKPAKANRSLLRLMRMEGSARCG